MKRRHTGIEARHTLAFTGALLLATSVTALAGEALDIELPSMRTPVVSDGATSRAEVRAELAMARAQGMLDTRGEGGATASVLLARERFNATQTRELIARADLRREQQAEARLAAAGHRPAQDDLMMIVEGDEHGQIAAIEMIDFD